MRKLLRDTGRGAAATLGPRYSLAGSGQLKLGRQIDWLTVGLWAALVIGVGLVGWMALSLAGQLNKKS